jgi:hypothetical protein
MTYIAEIVSPNPALACWHIAFKACTCLLPVPQSLCRSTVPFALQACFRLVTTVELPASMPGNVYSWWQFPGSPASPSTIARAMSIGAAMNESVARAIRRKSTFERRNHMSDNQRRIGYNAATMVYFCQSCPYFQYVGDHTNAHTTTKRFEVVKPFGRLTEKLRKMPIMATEHANSTILSHCIVALSFGNALLASIRASSLAGNPNIVNGCM